MPSFFDWATSLALLVVGLFLALLAWRVLAQYRRIFFTDPRTVMSFEVLMNLLFYGSGPGYLAMFMLSIAAFFIFFGLLDLSDCLGRLAGWVVRADWSAPKI